MNRLYIALCIFLVLQTGCSKKENVIKIGAILPLTGDYAQYGNSVKNGIEIALKEINESRDSKIEFLIEDDLGDKKTSLSAINKLIMVDKVKIIVGAVPSGVTLSIAPVAEKNKIVLLSPTSTATAVKYAGDYIFRVCVSDEFEGVAMADYILKHYPQNNIGVLYINNDYGVGLQKDFVAGIIKGNSKIDLVEAYNPDTKDFRPIITKFKKRNINIIYLVAQKEQSLIFQQSYEINYRPLFTGSTMIEDPELIDRVGMIANGTVYTYRSYDPNDTNKVSYNFVQSYKSKYGKIPDFYAASGYDAARVGIDAVLNSSYDGDSIKHFLYNIKNFPGVTGKINFDSNGDVVQSFGIKTISNQKFTFLTK